MLSAIMTARHAPYFLLCKNINGGSYKCQPTVCYLLSNSKNVISGNRKCQRKHDSCHAGRSHSQADVNLGLVIVAVILIRHAPWLSALTVSKQTSRLLVLCLVRARSRVDGSIKAVARECK